MTQETFWKWCNQPTIRWLAVSDWPRTLELWVRFPTGLLVQKPNPVAARPEVWICGRSLAGIAGSKPAGNMNVSVVSVVCWQVGSSVSGWSLVQRSSTGCVVGESNHEASTMRRPWPIRGCSTVKKNTDIDFRSRHHVQCSLQRVQFLLRRQNSCNVNLITTELT
jgi:hypothetical protein